jgi:hypothetical protein
VSEENQFEQYWRNYGELHASMCGGDIKQFAKDIWLSASSFNEKRKAEIALEIFNEFDNSVPPSKNFENDWDKFMSWLDEKAKGE